MAARREYRTGSLWLRGNRFYLRFRQGGKQRAIFLVVKDDEFHSATCAAVRKKAKEKLEELGVSNPSQDGMKVADFWKITYPTQNQAVRCAAVGNRWLHWAV